MKIDAQQFDYTALNEEMRNCNEDFEIIGCLGHRFIGAGMSGRKIKIHGIPGNALGAYLNGAEIEVFGNAQDAVGDTMNNGKIIVHGNIGDAAGYAMRGGNIFVQGDAGYRAGLHMKAYKEKLPVMIIGGRTGSFLGEYQAGGIIIVLGLNIGDKKIVGNFPGTGMHGGKMFLRGCCSDIVFPSQVTASTATDQDMEEIKEYLAQYCEVFNLNIDEILNSQFTVVTPDSKNPYRQMYVAN